MSESQNIEYKSSWHDEYLKWICGFANAQGGRIYIGRDDTGKTVGVKDFKILMDEIPNKIKNNLGIAAEVNLLQENNKHFIEIIVQPYSVPISLRGRYYCRSGSVKQEHNSFANVSKLDDLDKFIHSEQYKYPTSICKEIDIVKNMLVKILNQSSETTIALVSDHGLTALSRLVDSKKYTAKASHEGRYIKLDSEQTKKQGFEEEELF